MSDELSSRALVSVKEGRLYCFRDEDDQSRDALLIDAINSVSSAIWTHCEREFKPTNGVTRTFALRTRNVNGSWVGWIDLIPYDLRSATTVTLYTDQPLASQDVLTIDEYRLRPVGAALGGTYLNLVTIPPAIPEEQPGFGWEATIAGDWGMAAVPADVRMAALQWIDNIVKNPGSYASVEMGGFTVAPDLELGSVVRAGMPTAVKHRLADFCRNIR